MIMAITVINMMVNGIANGSDSDMKIAYDYDRNDDDNIGDDNDDI